MKEEAFSKAIVSEQTEPLSSTFKPDNIVIDADYTGPNPLPDGPTTDMDAGAGSLSTRQASDGLCHGTSMMVHLMLTDCIELLCSAVMFVLPLL